ncbi:MAG: hypothetical protein WA705_19355 [Candidatus Ozemobacteraceae bacterium]
MVTRVLSSPVLFILMLLLGTLGCWNSGGKGDNPAGLVHNDAEPVDSSVGIAKSVQFRFALPGDGVGGRVSAAPLMSTIKASGLASVSVTFKLILINIGNASQPTTTLFKTVPVNASGTAMVSFSAIPALTCIGDIHIDGGKIGSDTDFHGATDLIAGIDNTIKISPKGSNTLFDVTARIIETLILSPEALVKIGSSLAQKVVSVVEKLDLNSTTVVEDASTILISGSPNSAKAITAFNFGIPAVTGVINESLHTVALTVPFGTNVTALAPTITHTGSSVSPNTGTAQNFTNPVTYTVTAANTTTQAYQVKVTVAANSAKAITAFNFGIPAVTGVINESLHTVALTVPFGTNVTALTPTITHTGSSVSPNTGTAQNFTNPVTYTVTAANTTTQAYVVTVSEKPALKIITLSATVTKVSLSALKILIKNVPTTFVATTTVDVGGAAYTLEKDADASQLTGFVTLFFNGTVFGTITDFNTLTFTTGIPSKGIVEVYNNTTLKASANVP